MESIEVYKEYEGKAETRLSFRDWMRKFSVFQKKKWETREALELGYCQGYLACMEKYGIKLVNPDDK